MKTVSRALLGLTIVAGLAACGIFEDQTPEFLSFQMDGNPGDVATVIYSIDFVSGVNETGVTRLEIFSADTVVHTLPIDTVIDIRRERQLFIQVETPVDTLHVSVRVDIDDRNIFAEMGDIFPELPWRYLYVFNRPVTDDLEVIF